MTTYSPPRSFRGYWPLLLALIVVVGCALATLQRIPNGSEHYYMIDSGETQVVLNVWGTLHATGYPLFILLSAPLVALMRGLGIDPATAPALISLLWGLLALALFGLLLARLTRSMAVSAAAVLLFGLTRTAWVHLTIAEIYSFTLLLLLGLYALALWPLNARQPLGAGQLPNLWERRIYAMALLGGAGIAHHRALVVIIPALLITVGPPLWALLRRRPLALLVCLALGLLGFLPYLYLPLREAAGAAWVYGEPETLAGFLDQFLGREANRFIGLPTTLAGIVDNFSLITAVLVIDLTVPGLVIGLLGLGWGIAQPAYRRAAILFSVAGVSAFLFHGFLYTDILSALILIITLSVAAGWAFALLALAQALGRYGRTAWVWLAGALATVGCAAVLIAQNAPFIDALTTDNAGREVIALAEQVPPGSTLMLPWGMLHFAVGFAHDVLGDLPDVTLVDHKADLREAAAASRLVVPAYLIYDYPPAWWVDHLGGAIYPHAAGSSLVTIALAPELASAALPDSPGASQVVLTTDADAYTLSVAWGARRSPSADASVFVHLVDAAGSVLAQDDQAAPVYGWRPLTTWQPGELVRDSYQLPRLARAVAIEFGLYVQTSDGAFVNEYEQTMPLQAEE